MRFKVFAFCVGAAICLNPCQQTPRLSEPDIALRGHSNIAQYWVKLTTAYANEHQEAVWQPIPNSITYRVAGAIEHEYAITVPNTWLKSFVLGAILTGNDLELRKTGMFGFEPMDFQDDWHSGFAIKKDGQTAKLTVLDEWQKSIGEYEIPLSIVNNESQLNGAMELLH